MGCSDTDVFIHFSFESDTRTYCRIIPCLQSGLKVRRICVGNPFAGTPQGLGDSALEKQFEGRNAKIRVVDRMECVLIDIHRGKREGKPSAQSYQTVPDQDWYQ